MKPKKNSKAQLTSKEQKLGVAISHEEEFKKFKNPRKTTKKI